MKLNRDFYNQPILQVAQQLLGKFLVRKCRGRKIAGKIVETEAYVGLKDKASHASRGRTKRTEIMFGQAGHAYVYMIYGMYYCLNIVTGREDYPAAVLIRAIETPLEGGTRESRLQAGSGPGKLCQYFRIDKKINGLDLTGNVLWIEDRGIKIPKSRITRAKRVGVDYAGEYKNRLWRFYIKDSRFISKT